MRLLLGALVAVCLSFLVVPAEAASGFQFEKVQFDPVGADLPVTNTKLNNEWVQIKNRTSTTKNLKGWKIYDRGRIHTFTFATDTRVAPGDVVRVHTGKGTASTRHRFWGKANYVWNNGGDTAYLYRPDGTRADSCAPSTGSGVKAC